MTKTLRLTTFADVDLADEFFDSLKAQYEEFSDWFARKASEPVYVVDNDAAPGLRGFVYLKVEDGEIDDVTPSLPAAHRLKVGTLKVNARGTKLGERIIKRIFDRAIIEKVEEIYVTIFDTHEKLIKLFKRYGFIERGMKVSANGTETVLLRSLQVMTGNVIKDYPFLHTRGKRKFLLAVKPEFHTDLFPDSILRGEDPDAIEDVAHTNTIHKVYVAKLTLTRMHPGDLIITYRTSDKPGLARFRSVATSVCVVEEVASRRNFKDVDQFLKFTKQHSVFSEDQLRAQYSAAGPLYAVRMTYNAAFATRPIRQVLLEDVGISEAPRWDLRTLTDEQFARVLVLGGVNEDLIVD